MHRRPPSGGGKRNNRLALLAIVISICATSQRARIKRTGRYVYCLPRGVYAANYLLNSQSRYSCRANFSFIVNAACLKLRPTMIHFEARGKVAASNSTNAVSFSSELITNRSLSPRCALAIQIIRPSESMAEAQPKLHPALWRLSAMISQYFTHWIVPVFLFRQKRQNGIGTEWRGHSDGKNCTCSPWHKPARSRWLS